MPIAGEVHARIQSEVVATMHANWVEAHGGQVDYDTFLRESKILEPDGITRTKHQRRWREAFRKRMVSELFADWANKQIAKGRDARECVFGAFVEENDLLVKERPQ